MNRIILCLKLLFFNLLLLLTNSLAAQLYPYQVKLRLTQITEESYKAHFDSLQTLEGKSRKVTERSNQLSDHDACCNYIYSKLSEYLTPAKVYKDEFDEKNFGGLTNIIGFKQGTKKEDGIWIVGAHYDSNNNKEFNKNSNDPSPGANDNGTGIAAMLELARVLSKVETTASILFVAWDMEEIFTDGYPTGSNHWFTQYVSKKKKTNWENIGNGGTIQLKDIAYCLNFDMFGNPQLEVNGKNVLWLFSGSNKHDMFLSEYAFTLQQFIPQIKTEAKGKLKYSDHYTFGSRDIPSIEHLESEYKKDPFYHTNSDNLGNKNNINFEFACDVTRGGLAYILLHIGVTPEQSEKQEATNIDISELPGTYIINSKEKNQLTIYNMFGTPMSNKHDGEYGSFSPRSAGLYAVSLQANNSSQREIMQLDKKKELIKAPSILYDLIP